MDNRMNINDIEKLKNEARDVIAECPHCKEKVEGFVVDPRGLEEDESIRPGRSFWIGRSKPEKLFQFN